MNTSEKTADQLKVEKLTAEAAALSVKLWEKVFEIKRTVAPETFSSPDQVDKETLDRLVKVSQDMITIDAVKQLMRCAVRIIDVTLILQVLTTCGTDGLLRASPLSIIQLFKLKAEVDEELEADVAIVCPCDKHRAKKIPAEGSA